MSKIKVHLQGYFDDSYKILIKPGIIAKLPKYIHKNNFGQRYCIITDNKVKKMYGDELLKNLRKNQIKADMLNFASGEKQKTWQTVEKLANAMIELKFTRNDCIIALGGGIVGDIAGFLASIYMRGIPYISVPTTLLAMVDSSVGGKTGINTNSGKNMLGSFYQPEQIYIDSKFLETLPIKEMRNGLAEAIKYAVIRNKRLFRYLEKKVLDIYKGNEKKNLKLNHKILHKIIKICLKIKVKIVEKDEKESSERLLLNYGHTFGHAIEKASKYSIPHGHAISIGMCLANQKAVKLGILKAKIAQRIQNLIEKAELPVTVPPPMKMKDLNKIMTYDKKIQVSGKMRYILIKKIGKPIIGTSE